MSNALTPSDLPEKRITPVLSPGLKQLLDSGRSSEAESEFIANSPVLLEEAKAVLPVLRAAAFQKAGEVGVRDVIGRRFALYPQPDRSDAEWLAWWSDYYDVLEGVAWPALEAAMVAHVASPDAEFLPKPGKLLELSREIDTKARRNFMRAQRAIDIDANREREKQFESHRAPTEEEREARRIKWEQESAERRAAIKELMKGFEAGSSFMASRDEFKEINDKLPSIAGKADAGGLTPEMRALMARRAERD